MVERRKGGTNNGLHRGMSFGEADLSKFPIASKKLIDQINADRRLEVAKAQQATPQQKKTYALDAEVDVPPSESSFPMLDIPGIIHPFRTRPRPKECPPELQQTLETASTNVVEGKLALGKTIAGNKDAILDHLGFHLDTAHFCAIMSKTEYDDHLDIDFNKGDAWAYVRGLVDASSHESHNSASEEVRRYFPNIEDTEKYGDPVTDLITDLTTLYIIREGVKESPIGSEEQEYWQGMERGFKSWLGKRVKPDKFKPD